MRLRESQRLQLLAKFKRADADVNDADTISRSRRIHITLRRLRGTDARDCHAQSIYGHSRVSGRLGRALGWIQFPHGTHNVYFFFFYLLSGMVRSDQNAIAASRRWSSRWRSAAFITRILLRGIPRETVHRMPQLRHLQLLLHGSLVLDGHDQGSGDVQQTSVTDSQDRPHISRVALFRMHQASSSGSGIEVPA